MRWWREGKSIVRRLPSALSPVKRLVVSASLKARAAWRKVPWSRVARYLAYVTLLVLVFLGSASVTMLLMIPDFQWLPQPDEARTFLATLLTAQAAIAALTLAVTLFVMQGVSARRDADDRMYQEYVRQSWVRPIFWGSISAVGMTGLVFLAQEFLGSIEETSDIMPGLANLILVAAIAFFATLVFSGILFEQALRLSHPERWSILRRNVNERDVRDSIQAYLGRRRRALDSLGTGQPDTSVLLPDSGEGSANQAIRSLLDDARRAMADSRLQEFVLSMESIKGLLEYALTEIEKQGIVWAPPGDRPEWPPLRELGRNLYSFREDVIRESNRDYVFELLGLDYWLLSTGARRRCGDLFTAGLESYRSNYRISSRVADAEVRELLRDRAWLKAPWTITGGELEDVFPYAFELVRHQERMLSDALHLDQPGDFEALHKEFETSLRLIRRDWDRRDRMSFSDMLEQLYRVVLMGLAGRAMILAESGRMEDTSRYLAVSRGKYSYVESLADDIAQAFRREDRSQASQWSEWEWEGTEPGIVQRMSAERYPLTFFAIHLMELSSDTMPPIDLHGTANQVLSWFESNADRLLPSVSERPEATREQCREWAAGALRAAVKRDEVEEDNRIIASELSPERVADFRSSVYANTFAAESAERIFEEAEAFLYLTKDTGPAPEEKGFFDPVPKVFLAAMPSNNSISYDPLEGDQLGRRLANDILTRLCEALDEAPSITAQLDTPEELLGAFDKAKTELDQSTGLVAVLAGDWFAISMALHAGMHEGFIPAWQLPDGDRAKQWGEYLGQTLLRGPRDGERRMYLVEPSSWGCFVRAQCEGDQDLRIDIKPISADRAQELLEANPNHFPDEPDNESKVRKLQTVVELAVCHRIEFRVKDHSRARRIVAEGRSIGSELTEAQSTND